MNYTSLYENYGTGNFLSFFSSLGTIWVITMISSTIIGIICLISMIKIFKKAGKRGIFAIIPIYNLIVIMKIIKMKLSNLLWLFIPIVGVLIFMWKYANLLAKAFGKNDSYTLGLFFFSPIFMPLLAFSSDPYVYNTLEKTEEKKNIDNGNITAETLVNNIEGRNVEYKVEVQSVETVTPVITQPQIDSAVTVENNYLNIQENIASNIARVESNDKVETIESTTNNIMQVDNLTTPNLLNNTELNNQIETLESNAFNVVSEPVMPIGNLNPQNEQIETLNLNTNVNNIKKCNNCGAEMPSVVSICPKCGTFND